MQSAFTHSHLEASDYSVFSPILHPPPGGLLALYLPISAPSPQPPAGYWLSQAHCRKLSDEKQILESAEVKTHFTTMSLVICGTVALQRLCKHQNLFHRGMENSEKTT